LVCIGRPALLRFEPVPALVSILDFAYRLGFTNLYDWQCRILLRYEAGFRSLTEAIDTTTPVGRMLTQVLGSFAEFERELIRERTKLGLARARAEGRVGGKRAVLSLKQQQHALTMVDEGKSQSEVA
jgi:DNA invertase Pin-like site-specific DNA recombinase